MEGRGERLGFRREVCHPNFLGPSRSALGFYRGHAGFSSAGREEVSADEYSSGSDTTNRTSGKREIVDG
jgi:hypothetical protein